MQHVVRAPEILLNGAGLTILHFQNAMSFGVETIKLAGAMLYTAAGI